MFRSSVAAVVATFVTASALSAQSAASVSGVVSADDGRPLAEVQVIIANTSTGFTTRVRTNDRGQYNLRQLPLGGPYVLRVETLGFRPVQQEGLDLKLGDRLRVDFTMPAAAVALSNVLVQADASRADASRFGTATNIRSEAIDALPTAGRDFSDLASLDPTFVRTGGRDLSISGQRGTQTEFMIDGMSTRRSLSGGASGQGAYTLSMAAIREFEVTRNEYDVTYGRSGGGINAVTKSGTNTFTGEVFGFHRNDRLTTRDYQGRPPTDFQLTQVGFALGGPILRDKLHFFTAYEQQVEATPFANGDLRNDQDEVDFRVSRDSVSRMLDILESKYGLTDRAGQFGQFTRRPLNQAAFARLDWQINPRNTLTFRNNVTRWRDPRFNGGDQQITLLEAKEGSRSLEISALATLRTTFSPRFNNEAKVQIVRLARFNEPNTDIPRGFVRIRSNLPNGTVGDTRLQFGGNRLSPSQHRETQAQLANTSYFQLDNQLITFGTDNMLTLNRSQESANQGGLFEFNSLQELENMTPFQYSRQAPFGERLNFATPRAFWGGAFAQTEYTATPNLTVLAGLRWDAQFFMNAPARNVAAEAAFGIRTDRLPDTDLTGFQPRVQLTWDAKGDGRRLVQVGGGAFRTQSLNWTTVNAYLGTGNQFADITLTGQQVPTPDFVGYRRDQSLVPGIPTSGAVQSAPAFLNVFGDDYRLPLIWKANAAVREDFGWASVGLNVLASVTSRNYAYFDRNLVETPAFTLPDGRGVLVPAASLPTNGRPNVNQARINSAFGRVFELVDVGEATNRALIVDAMVPLRNGAMISSSYTLNETRDNLSFNCCNPVLSTPVPGDHRDLKGALTASDYDFRHKVVLVAQLPEAYGFRVSARYEGQSGTPFSLMVGSDINGDGQANNDLAFVPDPNDPATAPAVAAAMRAVLDNPNNLARDYIRRSIGNIAERNGGRNPWLNRLDLRASRFFNTRGSQRAEVVLDVFNLMNLLNRSWGATRSLGTRQTLLNVTAFDRANQRYVYSVNDNVGVTNLSGQPYQIQLGMRYHF